jgi:hypothetical protein
LSPKSYSSDRSKHRNKLTLNEFLPSWWHQAHAHLRSTDPWLGISWMHLGIPARFCSFWLPKKKW